MFRVEENKNYDQLGRFISYIYIYIYGAQDQLMRTLIGTLLRSLYHCLHTASTGAPSLHARLHE